MIKLQKQHQLMSTLNPSGLVLVKTLEINMLNSLWSRKMMWADQCHQLANRMECYEISILQTFSTIFILPLNKCSIFSPLRLRPGRTIFHDLALCSLFISFQLTQGRRVPLLQTMPSFPFFCLCPFLPKAYVQNFPYFPQVLSFPRVYLLVRFCFSLWGFFRSVYFLTKPKMG